MQQIAYFYLFSPPIINHGTFGAVLLECLTMRPASGIAPRAFRRTWGFDTHASLQFSSGAMTAKPRLRS